MDLRKEYLKVGQRVFQNHLKMYYKMYKTWKPPECNVEIKDQMIQVIYLIRSN